MQILLFYVVNEMKRFALLKWRPSTFFYLVYNTTKLRTVHSFKRGKRKQSCVISGGKDNQIGEAETVVFFLEQLLSLSSRPKTKLN
jgi:hypothetical protein